MTRILFTVVALIFSATAVPAQDAGSDIRTVIQRQFDAFQADDFETAFTFASPLIQQMFGTAENFGIMVQRGYPMVHRPAAVEFLDSVRRGDRTYQDVQVTDRAGNVHLLEYEMVETTDGWEINGVRFKKPVAVGA